jgi:hypothetical protein
MCLSNSHTPVKAQLSIPSSRNHSLTLSSINIQGGNIVARRRENRGKEPIAILLKKGILPEVILPCFLGMYRSKRLNDV